MPNPLSSNSERIRFPLWLKWLLVFLLILGAVFRFVNLNHKVYWHDETYTSLRAAGYTRGEIDDELFQNRVVAASELQKFQRIKSGSTPFDTVRSLAVEDPQHPPLYFLMTRFWMQTLGAPLEWLFKSPLTVTRSLPAVISLLALPAMYALAWELFACHSIALLATTLLALSPFDVLFAQTARQYSLLTLMVIVSSYLLLRALHRTYAPLANHSHHYRKPPPLWHSWALYSLAIAVGLYTHPFFALTLAGHGVYVGLDAWGSQVAGSRLKLAMSGFIGAIAGAIVLYLPWLVVMVLNAKRAFATTDWSQIAPGIDYLLKLWTLSFTALFFDLDFGFNNPWTYLARLPFLILILVSVYSLCRNTRPSIWLFVLTSILVPFLLLALPDLFLGNKRSAVSRYLISSFPAVQLAVAYFLANKLSIKTLYSGRSPQIAPPTAYTLRSRFYTPLIPFLWRGVLVVLLTSSVISLTVSALATSWWNKDLSYSNDKIADVMNQSPSPIIISDIGDDFTNTGDLISLSYRFNKPVSLLLVKDSEIVTTDEFRAALQGNTAIAFRPSQNLLQKLEQTDGKLSPDPSIDRLWKLSLVESIPEKKADKIKRNIK
jgi:uncharacterized membrane protein